ncbi:MAG TPA: YceD family protein [Enterococcus sp.]|nr:YceD family protein [Enterococcus sp.]
MKWSLLELRKYQDMPLTFEETLDLKNELMGRDNQIIDLAPVKVQGMVTVSKKDYILHYTVDTVITLPSTRSLEPVELPLQFSVNEVFMTPEQYQQRDDQLPEEEVLILETQTLDLDDSVADNILLGIPMQVLTEAEKASNDLPSGDDWAVISEADFQRQQESQEQTIIDPRLAKLSALFKEEEE